MDDGETFDFSLKNERSLVEYTLEASEDQTKLVLKVRSILPNSFYDLAAEVFIQEISIYGIQIQPQSVFDLSQPFVRKGPNDSSPFTFDAKQSALHLRDLHMVIDEGDLGTKEQGKQLLEIVVG